MRTIWLLGRQGICFHRCWCSWCVVLHNRIRLVRWFLRDRLYVSVGFALRLFLFIVHHAFRWSFTSRGIILDNPSGMTRWCFRGGLFFEGSAVVLVVVALGRVRFLRFFLFHHTLASRRGPVRIVLCNRSLIVVLRLFLFFHPSFGWQRFRTIRF